MPLASSRCSTSSKAALNNHRLSLPSTIDSSTRVVTTRSQRAIERRRRSSSLQRGNNNECNSKRSRDARSPQKDKNQTRLISTKAVNGVEKNKENALSPGVTPYWKVVQDRGGEGSPRLTRSASKNGKDDGNSKRQRLLPFSSSAAVNEAAHEDYGPRGVVLNFSPPNQHANAKREKEEYERYIQERARRVEEAKERGRLLVFSPHGTKRRHQDVTLQISSPVNERMFQTSPPKSSNDEVEDCASAVSTMTSQSQSTTRGMLSSTETAVSASACSALVLLQQNSRNEEVANELKCLRQGMDQLLAGREKETPATAELERQRASQLEAQLSCQTEALLTANHQLEQTNKVLLSRFEELQHDMEQTKRVLAQEQTRLEAEVQSTRHESSLKIQELEESRHALEVQVSMLQGEKLTLEHSRTDLQAQLHASREKMDHIHALLETTRSNNSSEKDSLQQEIATLQRMNDRLNQNLQDTSKQYQTMSLKVKEYEMDLDKLQNQLLPESEEQLRDALTQLQVQANAAVRAQSQLEIYQANLEQLEAEAVTLRETMEQERTNFQRLNEDSSVAVEKIRQQMVLKDEKLSELTNHAEELQRELDRERTISQQDKHSFTQWEKEMEGRNSELDKALADTMSQLEEAESKEKASAKMLSDTLVVLQKEKIAKEQALDNDQRREAKMIQLEESCRHLHEEARNYKLRARDLERQLEQSTAERDYARQRLENHDLREEELFRKLMENERLRRDLHNRVMQLCGNIRVFVRVRPPIPAELQQLQVGPETNKLPPSPFPKKNGRKSTNSRNSTATRVCRGSVDSNNIDTEGFTPFHFPGIYDRDDDSSSVACHGTDDILKNLIEVTEPYKDRGGLSDRRKKWRFGFDNVFTPQHTQDDIWQATEPLVQSAIDGYNVTIFAFGQTGSGKTYTLLGEPGYEGLIARSITRLFEAKREMMGLSRGDVDVAMSVELLEIYNEQVRDLLAPNSGPNGQELSLKVTSSEVVGNEQVAVDSEDQVLQILQMAQKRRCVKATLSNAESSRSHMLFTIHFQVITKEGIQRFGKLNICDLAGSERLSKSGANTFVGGELLKETQHINKSLSTLSNVIERLQEGSTNVPFRESKLTFLLQNSLGGNSKTLAIVCCNPLTSHFHESLCSLRFAAKVSKVDLKAVANFSC